MPSETNVSQGSTPMAPSAGSGSAAILGTVAGHGARQSNAKSVNNTQSANANFPPPKTDKPRPHVCGTCSRSFARLEHLKRHERSHTKEKPFECPECTRCFARRDLLLRHQQKLHMTTTTSARPRSGRRESTSNTAGSGPGRVRKNSVANNSVGGSGGVGSAAMRPRANTISHVDNATLGLIAAANSSISRNGNLGAGHAHHSSLGHLPGPGGYEFRGMSTAIGNHGNHHGLPKLETHGLSINMSGGLRTAPAFGGFGLDHDVDSLLFGGPGSTINPAQLHFSDSPQSLAFGRPTSPYNNNNNPFTDMTTNQAMMDEDDSFDWMNGFHNQTSFASTNNEHAIEGSSPSAISTASQSGISEVMLDGSNNSVQTPTTIWQNAMMPPTQMVTNQLSMDMASTAFPEIISPPGTVSPKSLHAHNGGNDLYYSTPPSLTTLSPTSMMAGTPNQFIHPPMTYNSSITIKPPTTIDETPHHGFSSIQSITDNTRQALLSALSQSSTFGPNQRHYSQSSVSSPLSPGFTPRSSAFSASLPSTADLQRYVGAYLQYFHPHLPFLHIPTLTFDSLISTNISRPSSSQASYGQSTQSGGGGGLVLAMAAIGALYEFEHAASRELFESSKKMIQLYLEDRRKSDLSPGTNVSNSGTSEAVQNTPLWLVQAMLLNVIYGHNCGDKTAADIASTHCVALVRLARAAELANPTPSTFMSQSHLSHTYQKREPGEDIQMGDDGLAVGSLGSNGQQDLTDDEIEWLSWKAAEERKRTLYTIFILSSLLVSAYNHPPVLINSEIQLDLPCDEDVWAAESSYAWSAKGGRAAAEQSTTSFATALSTLLTASQRQRQQQELPQAFRQPLGHGAPFEGLPDSSLRPSTFGCLVLINALHNYIWETRQRHSDHPWTTQETEAMHAHIEPALMAWQTAWASNPKHTVERPNPFGMGPLSADSIPLLDLAYIRLFVNLGRSKDAFWQRDYDGMAEELARGIEMIQNAEHSPSIGSSGSDIADSINSANSGNASPSTAHTSPDLHPVKTPTPNHTIASLGQTEVPTSGQISKRERHLRKAAFYAADSLSMSDKLGVTFADFTSRELPLQSALCAFDCAQVLAEWVSAVQERVGRYLGILGKDDIDYTQVPGIMLLEDEDCKLLEKVTEVLNSAEIKMTYEIGGLGAMASMTGTKGMPSFCDCGYGSKILMVTAYMLDKAAVWPVTHLMAQSLETQAAHMNVRAESSLLHHR